MKNNIVTTEIIVKENKVGVMRIGNTNRWIKFGLEWVVFRKRRKKRKCFNMSKYKITRMWKIIKRSRF